MKLKRVIAEYLYLKNNSSILSFGETCSDTQDYYCRAASREIFPLIASYVSSKSWFSRIIKGSIQEFINAHGVNLNLQNCNSLSKRIVSQVKATEKQEYQHHV